MPGSVVSCLTNLFSSTDEQAMLRVQRQDDPRAFALLMRRWNGWTVRFCTQLIGDVHRAEDLAQEVFMRIFARRKEYRHEARFSTYLRRVALNVCYDELRRLKRHKASLLISDDSEQTTKEASSISPAGSPDVIAVNDERAEMVRQAVSQLPEHYRDVVILRHYEGLQFREIAEALGIPQGTAQSRMIQALTQLARLLGPILDDESQGPVHERGKDRPNRKELS